MPRFKTKSPVVIHTDVHSSFSEAYRKLKINIDFSSLEREIKTITVTSCSPGEGKTTAVLHLAISYANAGKKVIVVDGDVRKPKLHILLGKGEGFGLTDYLANPNSVVFDIINETILDNIALISSGTTPPNPSDLLVTKRMDSLLVQLKNRFDVVLIDTPPLLSVVDAKILAAKCDGVILILESGKIKEEFAKKARDELIQVKANVLGAVINKVNGKKTAKFPY